LVVNDPSIALALSLSRYKDNFIFDPIDDSNTESVTIIETVEELPSVRYCVLFFWNKCIELLIL
jgi:hypothetical protein